MQGITPFLWFDHQAEEAAAFYTSVFPNSRILEVSRYGDAGPLPRGTVMTVSFELGGQRFIALNGGPQFTFTGAISFFVTCDTQAEVDRYWERLTAGGAEIQCGWLTDRFGLTWQIVPAGLLELLQDPDPLRSRRTFEAMFAMKKLDLAALRRAHDGAER